MKCNTEKLNENTMNAILSPDWSSLSCPLIGQTRILIGRVRPVAGARARIPLSLPAAGHSREERMTGLSRTLIGHNIHILGSDWSLRPLSRWRPGSMLTGPCSDFLNTFSLTPKFSEKPLGGSLSVAPGTPGPQHT